MVIIDASQALDPGSIPGRRTQGTFFVTANDFFFFSIVGAVSHGFLGR